MASAPARQGEQQAPQVAGGYEQSDLESTRVEGGECDGGNENAVIALPS